MNFKQIDDLTKMTDMEAVEYLVNFMKSNYQSTFEMLSTYSTLLSKENQKALQEGIKSGQRANLLQQQALEFYLKHLQEEEAKKSEPKQESSRYGETLKQLLNKYGFTDVDYSNAKPIKFTATSLGNLFEDISNLQDALGQEILEEMHRTGCFDDPRHHFQ